MNTLYELPNSIPIPIIIPRCAGHSWHYNHLAHDLSDNRVDAVDRGHFSNLGGDGMEQFSIKLIDKKHPLPIWAHSETNRLKILRIFILIYQLQPQSDKE